MSTTNNNNNNNNNPVDDVANNNNNGASNNTTKKLAPRTKRYNDAVARLYDPNMKVCKKCIEAKPKSEFFGIRFKTKETVTCKDCRLKINAAAKTPGKKKKVQPSNKSKYAIASEKLAGLTNPEDYRICSGCVKVEPLESFIGDKSKGSACVRARGSSSLEGRVLKTCAACRLKYKIYDASSKRKKRKRERNQKLKKEDPIKYASYSKKSRAKKRVEMGDALYKETMARKARESRKKKKFNNTYKSYDGVSSRLSYYKSCADTKNNAWELTDDQAIMFFKSRCFYCKQVPTEACLMGIDRLCSGSGYNINNAVPCCTECNMMKGCMDPKSFIVLARKIASNMNLTECNNEWKSFKIVHPRSVKASYNTYKKRATNNLYEFTLTKEEFDEIVSGTCYYCDQCEKSCGLDRVSSSLGYTKDNVVPACKMCNYFKRDLDKDYFKDKVCAIALNDSIDVEWFRGININLNNMMVQNTTTSCNNNNYNVPVDMFKYINNLYIPSYHICTFTSCTRKILKGIMCNECISKKNKMSTNSNSLMEAAGYTRCTATTKTLKPCNRWAEKGTKHCTMHTPGRNPDAVSPECMCLAAKQPSMIRCKKKSVGGSKFCQFHKTRKNEIEFPSSTDITEIREYVQNLIKSKNVILKGPNPCEAYTRSKTKCKCKSLPGHDVCYRHMFALDANDKFKVCLEYFKHKKNEGRNKK